MTQALLMASPAFAFGAIFGATLGAAMVAKSRRNAWWEMVKP